MKTELSNSSKTNTWDVIVIGGGATGAGTARDCARRGLRTLMLERHDIATGATGRNHGLLHSGSRYAVTDRESAEECIKENMILKRIASHCVEKTDGLFLTLPEDDIAFQSKFIEACHTAGIDAKAIDPKEALHLEPSANPSIIGAVVVPDGTVDPFRLTLSNIVDAKQHGATIETYHEVLGLIKEQNRVIGVKVYDHITKQEKNLYASVVVNAGGIWGQKIAEYADLKIKMFPAKGSLLIFGHRVNNMVLNRCRKPADSDILVPGDTICLIGTTSTHVPYEEIDNMYVTPEEVDILIREGGKLSPTLLQTRILRGYAGVRPLVASDDDPTGRNVSRGIVLLDHATRDGLEGFITITGGKLMTYRLMAEWATDLVCKKLNNTTPCTTAESNLPGSQQSTEEINQKMTSVPTTIRKSAIYRLGDMAENLKANKVTENSLVCECEEVSVGEVEYAINELHVNNLIDLRRRTRVGMGTCQGELCACRAAGLMNHYQVLSPDKSKEDLTIFLNERWKGIRPIAWGDTLRESEFTSWVYEGVCGLDMTQEQIKKAKDEI
ncbi:MULTISPECIES: anaerobic glycerol-3-phosphate dehydrogenase subunit A [Apibacter]|uniref:anaerobic glycerol-3-phosphate dehydrogenase subunit A n=1 Tax=Apibacter TaxID=1778601 RepID=UPI00132C86AA|nr:MULTISPECIES: anaerobic glycerol-3-phosphate dehydrogenase subunit A [Apibacter]MXO25091.1 anaerobic glycerol-3-phosphate dehydrogenase subunit A [Apibacter sp. B3924]MXO27158.1 anaerobic glycerol-3-phosphate dehydrogenase subunit A [Apibacter sp. B3813]MXO28971.1 anaerobic glycerol-3-phosphate dehydrogenase subunit A [Apibacter sp. B3913]MXO31248.1 anaerobic glycerol-3-phosphate dehydrogenase subunit A [Apibacter sp. B3912]MXP02443.1 anaerobic glycerol-3-phosphate dehydrogenase subunit A [